MEAKNGVWGPEGRKAAFSVTFDHLGEAAEIQVGALPRGGPFGGHHSVTQELPALLQMLAQRDYAATFFIEAWNLDIYPEAVVSIAKAGHDLGWHGWLHEPWYQTPADALELAIQRSLDAFGRIGIRPRGARPPGGLLGSHSLNLLEAAGFDYVSLAGNTTGIDPGSGLPMLPYPWHVVDGAYYVPGFTRLRKPPGDDVVGPDGLLEAYAEVIRQNVEDGGFVSFVFHVPWQDTPEKVAAIGTLIDQLATDSNVWLASAGEAADWMREHPHDFPSSPHRDEAPAW